MEYVTSWRTNKYRKAELGSKDCKCLTHVFIPAPNNWDPIIRSSCMFVTHTHSFVESLDSWLNIKALEPSFYRQIHASHRRLMCVTHFRQIRSIWAGEATRGGRQSER